MKTVGIICEYNPFHLGHLRQFELMRQMFGEDTAIICVMSGHYVQRGEPAMWDKFSRAGAAVACGADLVLELPITKVLQSAEGFARGGVEILDRLGCVDHLSFGAECGDADALMTLAKELDCDESKMRLRTALSAGLPYAAARQSAVSNSELLHMPNNILGSEYCRALLHFNSSISPIAVLRNGSYHAETPDTQEPSATSIRSLYPDPQWTRFVPPECSNILSQASAYILQAGERALLARLRAMSTEEWENCAHGSEGLWNKAMKASRSCSTYEEIIAAVKSKRYPRTRIQRLLLCAYLGISSQDLLLPISYTRLLAASKTGRQLLRTIKEDGTLPIVNPGQEPTDKYYYSLETTASDLFTLFGTEVVSPCRMEQNARLKF